MAENKTNNHNNEDLSSKNKTNDRNKEDLSSKNKTNHQNNEDQSSAEHSKNIEQLQVRLTRSQPQNEDTKHQWSSRTQSLPSRSSQCIASYGICHLILNSLSETSVPCNRNHECRNGMARSSDSSSKSSQLETAGKRSGTITSVDSLCRICQLTRKESEEPIPTAACHCKGGMGRIHRSCLREWVEYRGSVRCEICQHNFEDLTPSATPSASDLATADAVATARRHEAMEELLQAIRPFSKRKRTTIGAVVIFLVVITCMTSIISVKADRKIKRLTNSPYSSKQDIDHSNLVLSVCVGVAFFCATITVGLAVIWAVIECCYIIHRRKVLRRAGIRLLATNVL